MMKRSRSELMSVIEKIENSGNGCCREVRRSAVKRNRLFDPRVQKEGR